MELKEIRLVNFKNYKEAHFSFHHKLNTIVGMNGMGKTNLMDGIYYLCMGKSYFTSSDKHVVRQEADFIRLDGKVNQHRIEVKVIPGKEKEILEDGAKFEKITDYIGRHPIVVVAPYDIYQLLAASENRRIFINNTLVQYDARYLRELMVYNRLLKNRNALLKSFLQEKRQNLGLLETISQQMSGPSDYISEARSLFVKEIAPIFRNHYEVISGERETAGLEYLADLGENKWADTWKSQVQKDLVTGRTNSGIHKDDLQMSLDDRAVREFASQGQTKSYVLALKFSQYDVLKGHSAQNPILLLDDVFDKLDPHRVRQLLGHVTKEDFGQVFITDTDSEKIPAMLRKHGLDFKEILIG